MARRYAPGFVATATDGAKLHFATKHTRWQVGYTPAPQAVALAKQYSEDFVEPTTPIKLIEGDTDGEQVILHPHTLDASSPNFLQPKYDRLETITLKGFGFMYEANDIEDVNGYLADLPAGFIRDLYHGLGLNYDIRLIIETIEKLTANAFILRLAFGVPVLLFQGQATVGGRSYRGLGDKRSDFLLRAASTGNLSIVEIKTPQADLLAKKEYRGGIYAPSQDLSGAVAQVLDQRWQLQRNNTQLRDDHERQANPDTPDKGPRPEAYAIQCVVIAGKSPREPNTKKSFELYRNGLAGVLVLTFDELLLKLETLLELLRNPDATKLVVPTVTVKKPKPRKKPGPGRRRR